jgi:predicted GTPase
MRVVMYLHLKNGSDTLTVAVSQEGKDLMVMDEAGFGQMADAIAEAVANVKDQLSKIKEGV